MPAESWLSRLRFISSTATRGVFSSEIIDERLGKVTLRIGGNGAYEAFKNEPGGHRWQQLSGKQIHTSTVTVAVLPEPTAVQVVLQESDLEIGFTRGSGKGGQHRNKTDSCVQIKHKPTGIMVRCETERSQASNKESALSLLRAKLYSAQQQAASDSRDSDRKTQVGTGQRGDKRRTIRTQDDQVTDHITGKTWRFKDYSRGNI